MAPRPSYSDFYRALMRNLSFNYHVKIDSQSPVTIAEKCQKSHSIYCLAIMTSRSGLIWRRLRRSGGITAEMQCRIAIKTTTKYFSSLPVRMMNPILNFGGFGGLAPHKSMVCRQSDSGQSVSAVFRG